MKSKSSANRLLLVTGNDAILMVLAFFAYRNGLWVIALLLAAAALISTGYLLLRGTARP